jgi:hypothetical protein
MLYNTHNYCLYNFVHHLVFKKHTQKNTMIRKLELFPSSGEGWDTYTLLVLLERANFNHWISF